MELTKNNHLALKEPLMDYSTPCLTSLLGGFFLCFRFEPFQQFRRACLAWIVCLGKRSLSRLFETTKPHPDQSHCSFFRLFSQAGWNWDEVCRILLTTLLVRLVPAGKVWLVVDDTLCHKRGARVAFGGIFLDAVLSSKRHKVFRFGTNWVTLGLVIELPFRRDRFFCLNILWRIYSKKDKTRTTTHRTKLQLAREMVDLLADWYPQRPFVLVADCAYMGKDFLQGLPENVSVIGPIHWKAVLTQPLKVSGKSRRKIGPPLGNPRQALEDPRWAWRTVTLVHPKGEKELRIKELETCCWYKTMKSQPLRIVLVQDPQGEWREEALLCSEMELSWQEVIVGYMRRWSVEVAYLESKQLLGFQDPQVWKKCSVERAHPMAWFVGSVVVLWYEEEGQHLDQAHRHRRWYKHKVSPTFSDMLSSCRWHLWKNWLEEDPLQREDKLAWLLEYLATAA